MPFVKGQSGNPTGRRPGTQTKQTRLREQLLSEAPAILAALVEQAQAGDPAASKLVLDRCLPVLRPTDSPVPLALGNLTL